MLAIYGLRSVKASRSPSRDSETRFDPHRRKRGEMAQLIHDVALVVVRSAGPFLPLHSPFPLHLLKRMGQEQSAH
jgi:hypothetical protein